MNKILIAYATRYGATADTANAVASVLRDTFHYNVVVQDIKKVKEQRIDLSEYGSVVLGVSVAMFRWAKEGNNFLSNNDLHDKKLAIFVSAGATIGFDAEKRDANAAEAVRKYIENNMHKYGLHPVAKTAFGGRFHGKDNWNRDDIVRWAEEIAPLLG